MKQPNPLLTPKQQTKRLQHHTTSNPVGVRSFFLHRRSEVPLCQQGEDLSAKPVLLGEQKKGKTMLAFRVWGG